MKNADMPAMPLPLGTETTEGCQGLTKREMMAMHMMAGMISGGYLRASDANQMPGLAVLITDKFLAELERTCHKT